MATTVQRIDERLDKLADLLKSGQLSVTAYPSEQNDQPLQISIGLNCRTCGRNGHKASEYLVHLMAIHRGFINVSKNNSRNYNNEKIPKRRYNEFYSQRVERGNTFQPRAIRRSYNPRYYNK